MDRFRHPTFAFGIETPVMMARAITALANSARAITARGLLTMLVGGLLVFGFDARHLFAFDKTAAATAPVATAPVAVDKHLPADDRYTLTLSEAVADLDAGRIAAATSKLDSTPANQRDIEYRYLRHRIRLATAENQPAASGLIQLKKPDVETRYGVLNVVNGHFAYICRDGSIHVHNLTTIKQAAIETPINPVSDTKAEPAGTVPAGTNPGEPATISHAAEIAVVKHPAGSTVWSGAFSLDGRFFFSGHENGEVLMWDTKAWTLKRTIPVGESWPVRELAAAPDGSSIVAENKTELALWNVEAETPQRIAAVGERFNFGEGLSFSPTGDLVATGGMFDILFFDARTGAERNRIRHASYTMGLEFSPDGKSIASAPRGNVNRFLARFRCDGTSTDRVFEIGPLGNYVAGMVFTPSGNRIIATGCEKEVRVYDANNGKTVLSFPRTGCSAKPAVSQDGRFMGWNEDSGFWYVDLGEPAE